MAGMSYVEIAINFSFDVISVFRHLISGSLVLVSLTTPAAILCRDLSLTLTTLALNQRSLR